MCTPRSEGVQSVHDPTSRSYRSPLSVISTNRFSVLTDTSSSSASDDCSSKHTKVGAEVEDCPSVNLPVLRLSDLLLHKQRNKSMQVRETLWTCLQKHGFAICTYSSDSQPCQIVRRWKESLERDFFPVDNNNNNYYYQAHKQSSGERNVNKGKLEASTEIHLSEKSVPMWRLGYELCNDDVREAFRVHAGRPDDQPWPCSVGEDVRSIWLQGLALCQDICDQALQLTLGGFPSSTSDAPVENLPIRKRPGLKRKSWLHPESIPSMGDIPERSGDYSVLYSMHYFNDNQEKEKIIDSETFNNGETLEVNVKSHLDPSMFVVEPFTTSNCPGLQVFDPSRQEWIDCDGPASPINNLLEKGDQAMVIFVGKAFAAHCPPSMNLQATLHRVVKADQSRRTIIYEQKYEEYFS